MRIKQGYGSKPTDIKIEARDKPSQVAECWIVQEGIGGDIKHSETLAYMTLLEVIALRDELNETIKEMVGL